MGEFLVLYWRQGCTSNSDRCLENCSPEMHSKELHNLESSPDIIMVTKSGKIKLTGIYFVRETWREENICET
jgi:hypothetical protein